HVHLTLDDSFVPGSSQIFNNHIPLDPQLNAALAISKSTPLLNVTRGQLVPYTITVRNVGELPLLQDVRVVDRFPAGFRYIAGSARIDNVAAEPAVVGHELAWSDLVMDRGEQRTIVMLLAVGAGVGEGEFVNRAQALFGVTGIVLSGEASATVRVVPDPTFDCTDVTGKVFNDVNRNGYEDSGEQGLPGIRLVTARGLSATTDAFGRYHITCAITPIEGRGSNFILKLDDRTLPSGYRLSTEPVRVQRATRGKALRINFCASIYRVVSLDLADAVFEPGTSDMRSQWRPRIQALLEELRKSPAVLRLSYVAEVEDERLVERRLNSVKQEVQNAWKAMDCCYQLTIEPEVFWRLGSPPKQSAVRAPASR
ncbi:MAG: isopeptide-forming domain-containing fimbrial protein, partial [Steroidobacterales bacterium]